MELVFSGNHIFLELKKTTAQRMNATNISAKEMNANIHPRISIIITSTSNTSPYGKKKQAPIILKIPAANEAEEFIVELRTAILDTPSTMKVIASTISPLQTSKKVGPNRTLTNIKLTSNEEKRNGLILRVETPRKMKLAPMVIPVIAEMSPTMPIAPPPVL